MPDAARLIAALSIALTAFIVSGQIMDLFDDGRAFGYFVYINCTVGAICGWKIMGSRAGRGIVSAINMGLTGSGLMVFWNLFIQGAYEMFDLAMRNRFDDPFEALGSIFEIGLGHGYTMSEPHILITLAVGGVVGGIATEFAWRQWR